MRNALVRRLVKSSTRLCTAGMSTTTTSPARPVEATLGSSPVAGQTIVHKDVRYTTIKEGRAYILVPPEARTVVDPKVGGKGGAEQAQNVFYNPIQQFNRDLSVLAIRVFADDFSGRVQQRVQEKSNEEKLAAPRREKRKRHREKAVEAPSGDSEQQKLDPKDSVIPFETETETAQETTKDESNAKKRKAEDEGSLEASEAKKQKTTTSNRDLDDDYIEPAKASALPPGERPDDKLRRHLRILDALSATGLRALRYAAELPIATQIVANDLLATATDAIRLNVTHNRLNHAITATTANAQAHMYLAAFAHHSHAYAKYDVIDLDPYGTAVPFLVQALPSPASQSRLPIRPKPRSTCPRSSIWFDRQWHPSPAA